MGDRPSGRPREGNPIHPSSIKNNNKLHGIWAKEMEGIGDENVTSPKEGVGNPCLSEFGNLRNGPRSKRDRLTPLRAKQQNTK
jgi:hypothetical protein